jgi:hypothetical protein
VNLFALSAIDSDRPGIVATITKVLSTSIDHLDGVLFLDRVASLLDDVFRRKNYGPPPSEPGTGSSSGGARERTG